MADEYNTGDLEELVEDLGLTDAEKFRLAITLGSMLAQSWLEGYEYADSDAFSEGWNEALSYNADMRRLLNASASTEH